LFLDSFSFPSKMASIALTAVVHPSRLLRAGLLAFALAAAAAALMLLLPDAAFHFPHWMAVFCMLACALALHARARHAKAHQIDISGLGQIRLTVQQNVDRTPVAVPVQLLPASTLWPQLLLLLLRDGAGRVSAVVVLPDSVAPGTFRALAVACRALGRRDGAA
jgi:hypothetical protein